MLTDCMAECLFADMTQDLQEVFTRVAGAAEKKAAGGKAKKAAAAAAAAEEDDESHPLVVFSDVLLTCCPRVIHAALRGQHGIPV